MNAHQEVKLVYRPYRWETDQSARKKRRERKNKEEEVGELREKKEMKTDRQQTKFLYESREKISLQLVLIKPPTNSYQNQN